MITNSADLTGVLLPMNCQDKETNHGNTKMQNQPQPITEKKVAVVYYLSRNGQLEHPHFMHVSLSSCEGLYLRDVIKTLNILRGQGMASMYSWASKRGYKNAFIWQDLSDDDLIYPCHDQDYILKGSLLFETSLSFRSQDSISSFSTSSRSLDTNNSSNSDGEDDSNFPITRRKNHSCRSTDDEHRIYKAKTTGQLSRKGSNASTQTDHNRRSTEEFKPEGLDAAKLKQVSAPASKSMRVNKSAAAGSNSNIRYQKGHREKTGGLMAQTKFLMKLIGCGCGSKRSEHSEVMENRY